MPAAAEATKDVAPPGMWGVKDLNAKTAPRSHEPVPGVTKILTATDFCWMEPGLAAKFLCDEAFEVVNDKHVRQNTLPSQEVAQAGRKRLVLEDGQLIATPEELTQDALYRRAARVPGGENLSPKSSKASLIKFLRDNKVNDVAEPAADDDDADLEELDDDIARKILEGK